MFTGIVEEIGIVEKVVKGKLMHIIVRAAEVLKGTKIGDSINVNGVCLTAVSLEKNTIAFDVMKETQDLTNLNFLIPGDGVNLERAISSDSRFGGHIVSGHVDGIGLVLQRINKSDEFWLQIEAGNEIIAFLVPKAAIAIDGVSLTIVEVHKKYFSVSLIPHTLRSTTLSYKEPKNPVNLEVDMLAKYVFRYFDLKKDDKIKLSPKYLEELGFDE